MSFATARIALKLRAKLSATLPRLLLYVFFPLFFSISRHDAKSSFCYQRLVLVSVFFLPFFFISSLPPPLSFVPFFTFLFCICTLYSVRTLRFYGIGILRRVQNKGLASNEFFWIFKNTTFKSMKTFQKCRLNFFSQRYFPVVPRLHTDKTFKPFFVCGGIFYIFPIEKLSASWKIAINMHPLVLKIFILQS